MHTRYIIFLLALFVHAYALAQEVRLFKYNENNGLNSELIKNIYVAPDNFLWLATDGGIYRYNGISFDHFDIDLPAAYAKYVIQRKNGKMLASTDEGLYEFENNLLHPNAKILLRASKIPIDTVAWYPKQVVEDANENIWLADNLQIFKLTPQGEIQKYEFADKDRTSHFQSSFAINFKSDGLPVVFSKNGFLYHFQTKTNSFQEINLNNKIGEVAAASILSDTQFLVAANGNVYLVDINYAQLQANVKLILDKANASGISKGKNGKIYVSSWTEGVIALNYHNTSLQYKKLFIQNRDSYNTIFVTENNDIWLGSDIGLSLVQYNEFEKVDQTIERDYIQDVHTDQYGQIYFTSGHKIFKTQFSDSIQNVELIKEVSDRFILQIIPDKNGMWLADAEGYLTYESSNGARQTFSFSEYGTAIFFLMKDNENNIWLCQDKNDNLIRISPDLETFFYGPKEGILSRPLVVKQAPDGSIYAGGFTVENYLFKYNKASDKFDNLSLKLNYYNDINLNVNDLAFDNNQNIYLATLHGLLKFNGQKVEIIEQAETMNTAINSVTTDKLGNVWMGTAKGLLCMVENSVQVYAEWHGLNSKSINYRNLVFDSKGNLWIGTTSGLAVKKLNNAPTATPTPQITHLETNSGPLDITDQIHLYETNFLKIVFHALSYPGQYIDYQYRILPTDTNWTNIRFKNEIFIPALEPNTYTLELRAKQKGNFLWSEVRTIELNISPRWYTTWWGILIIVVLLFGITYLSSKIILWKADKDKKMLEMTIASRTAELDYQRKAMQQQRDIANHHLEQISKQNKDITDSIQYAKRIQTAILPPESQLKCSFPEHFIIFKPRDIVSGDFYWYLNKDNITTLAVGDCTGHGVPGAFMSMLGISLLNELSNHHLNSPVKLKASNILSSLRTNLKNSLRQNNSEKISKDGIDISMVIVDFLNKTIQFSGAYLPILLVKKETIHFIKGDRMPIGFYIKEKEEFQNHEFQFEEGDMLYMFSDGFADQVGGIKGRKYMMTSFREFIVKNAALPIAEQLQALDDELQLYMQGYKQMDDITVLGIKLTLTGLRLDSQNSHIWDKYHFLVAEDDINNLLLLETLLKPTQVKLTKVTNGLEAVMSYNSNPTNFDLILMDLHMPIMHGVSAIKEIRKEGHNVPIIVLTAFTQDDLKSNAFQAGANDYLLKPIQTNELLATISKYLIYK